jgi:hypothetical protein
MRCAPANHAAKAREESPASDLDAAHRAPPSSHLIDPGSHRVFLVDHLSVALTAHIAGVDRRTVTRWADRSQGHAERKKKQSGYATA